MDESSNIIENVLSEYVSSKVYIKKSVMILTPFSNRWNEFCNSKEFDYKDEMEMMMWMSKKFDRKHLIVAKEKISKMREVWRWKW